MATAERTAPWKGRFPAFTLATGTVLLAAALWLFGGGIVGVTVGVAIGFVAASSEPYYGVALAHLAALLVSPTPPLGGVVVLELASVALLSTDLTGDRRASDAVLLVGASGVALGVVTALATVYGTLVAATALVGAAGIAGYGLHRLGLWKLGVLSEASP